MTDFVWNEGRFPLIPLGRLSEDVTSSDNEVCGFLATPGLIFPDPGTNQLPALLKDLSDRGRETVGQ